MNINIEISIECYDWNYQTDINQIMISDITQSIINRYNTLKVIHEIELSILLTDDAKMLSLNTEFRDIKKATNVLSFMDLDIHWQELSELNVYRDYLYLGDIAFGYQTIQQEAIVSKTKFINHFKHLLIHAILHLLGYTHTEDEEAHIMERLEDEILAEHNIILSH